MPNARSRARATGRRCFGRWPGPRRQYHRCLLESPEAEPARQYLQRRGITAESIEKFHLGFSPGSLGLDSRARPRAAPLARRCSKRSGFLVRRDDGSRYDRFKGRVLFSIRDAQGRPVGLGGRVLPEFGCDEPGQIHQFARDAAVHQEQAALRPGRGQGRDARGPDTALVMEGYTDAIVAHQYGFDNAVAVLGTALGDEHVRILKRFADRVVLVLDGDEAGQQRTNEVLELFVAQEVDLRILTLPEGADPCDFLQEHGAEAFRDRCWTTRRSTPWSTPAACSLAGWIWQRDVHGASQALDKMVAVLAKAPRPSGEQRFREDKILSRLAQDFAVPEKDIRDRLTQLRRRSRKPVYTSPADGPPPDEVAPDGPPAEPMHLRALHERRRAQCELLEILVSCPELLPAAREAFSLGANHAGAAAADLRGVLPVGGRGRVPDFSRLMLEFDERGHEDAAGRAGRIPADGRAERRLGPFTGVDCEVSNTDRSTSGTPASCSAQKRGLGREPKTGPAASDDGGAACPTWHFRSHGWVGP